MEERCEECRYGVPVYMGDGEELMCACVYILRTGRRRPCPPGRECRVFEPAQTDICAQAQGKEIFG